MLGRQHCLRWNCALSLHLEVRAKHAMKQDNTVMVDVVPGCNTDLFLLALFPLHSGTELSVFSLAEFQRQHNWHHESRQSWQKQQMKRNVLA